MAFPSSPPVPLPKDLSDALDFVDGNDDAAVVAFRERQLYRLESLATTLKGESSHWYSFCPEFTRPATGVLHVALAAQLSAFLGLNATDWLMQFVHGFPIDGTLSQRFTFPLDLSRSVPPVDPTSLFLSKTPSFVHRARRAPVKHAHILRAEAMDQVAAGWLAPPRLLDTRGDFADNPLEDCNTAFRFGVPQEDKLRGCGDLKDSLTNTACAISTPITLCGWDHIDEASVRLRPTAKAWAFGKVDHKAAYKFLPIRENDPRFPVIAIWNPVSEDWFGFSPRTQLFGSTASVLHYNCFSRLLTTWLTRILRLPVLGCFDDFGFFTTKESDVTTLQQVLRFCDILGIPLKIQKSEVGTVITFLGLRGQFPSPSNEVTLKISLTPTKALKWDDTLLLALHERVISHAGLESLIGRLNFAQSTTFNKFARCMLKTLYAMLYDRPYFPDLCPAVRRSFYWWHATLSVLPPRVVGRRKQFPDFVIFTDASYEEAPLKSGLGAVLFEGGQSGVGNPSVSGPPPPVVIALLTRTASPEDIAHFRDTSVIYGLELFTVVATIFTLRYRLRGCSVAIFVDNNAALCALIKGDSLSVPVSRLIPSMWYLSATFCITLCFERVSSASNIADAPSRGRALPLPLPDSSRFGLPSIKYCADYISNILQNVRDSIDLTSPALAETNGDVSFTQFGALT